MQNLVFWSAHISYNFTVPSTICILFIIIINILQVSFKQRNNDVHVSTFITRLTTKSWKCRILLNTKHKKYNYFSLHTKTKNKDRFIVPNSFDTRCDGQGFCSSYTIYGAAWVQLYMYTLTVAGKYKHICSNSLNNSLKQSNKVWRITSHKHVQTWKK